MQLKNVKVPPFLSVDKSRNDVKASPADPDGGGAPAFCHSVASMAMRLTKASSTHIRMFSGLMSVWMILHFEWR